MKTSGIYLLIYDVGSDRIRDRVSKTVSGYGTRVQKSAFECRLTRGLKKRLWSAIGELSLAAEDRIALYPLAASPANRKGAEADEPMSEIHHAVIL